MNYNEMFTEIVAEHAIRVRQILRKGMIEHFCVKRALALKSEGVPEEEAWERAMNDIKDMLKQLEEETIQKEKEKEKEKEIELKLKLQHKKQEAEIIAEEIKQLEEELKNK